VKTRTFVLVILVFLIVSVSFAGGPCWMYKGYYVNEDYDNRGPIARCYISDGCWFEIYEKPTSETPLKTGKLAWLRKEQEGRLFITVTQNGYMRAYFILVKFSDTYLEAVWSEKGYPDEINPNDSNYLIYYHYYKDIYYRQKYFKE